MPLLGSLNANFARSLWRRRRHQLVTVHAEVLLGAEILQANRAAAAIAFLFRRCPGALIRRGAKAVAALPSVLLAFVPAPLALAFALPAPVRLIVVWPGAACFVVAAVRALVLVREMAAGILVLVPLVPPILPLSLSLSCSWMPIIVSVGPPPSVAACVNLTLKVLHACLHLEQLLLRALELAVQHLR